MIERVEVVRLEREHIAEVARLEAACFADPWSEQSLEILLGEHAVGFVACNDGRVVAYAGMICVLDEGQITNVAVSQEVRRRGIGRMLMRAIEEYARENAIIYLSLEVRESNAAARSLYTDCGWVECGVRKNFYSHPSENALIMTRVLS